MVGKIGMAVAFRVEDSSAVLAADLTWSHTASLRDPATCLSSVKTAMWGSNLL
jgi:hypothetical protein